MNFFLCDLLRHASGVWGNNGVYAARPSALYASKRRRVHWVGPSVAFIDLTTVNALSIDALSATILRCARNPVTSAFPESCTCHIVHAAAVPQRPKIAESGSGTSSGWR
ncbi:hypothetical protein THAOC_13298 [Thalassiosira oceanica]|uniref:Uncharacterized protein n=1 Tax=Thalassiosira oceanica TaxID=159749 RepID=K0SXR3_THAOC|nr:hypothetical protein THAOC_13298 [Thalassiosira oceanica]|eukprot:EJK65806.1 hypothetical protein THAOC_13298 [Thalassiosira oceanica]